MSKLTVILPAAGRATRLQLPYAKEVMSIGPNKSLIDNSFNFFRDYGRKDVEFVVVIREGKSEIVDYLAKYNNRYDISFTFQNPNEHEYTGAIKSARHLFGEHNIVLLPDTVMKLDPGADLYECVMSSLTETGFTFLYKDETSVDLLKTKGALVVEDGIIKSYEDKPEQDVEKYNAFWCAFAYRRRAFDQCINFMEKSTLRQRVMLDEIKETPIYNSKGIRVQDYIDLGTWPEVRRYLNEENCH